MVGPHGGAFGNLVFTPPGASAIEFLAVTEPFRRGDEIRSMYWGLAQAAGVDYWVVEPAGFGFNNAEMTVDVDTLVDTVRASLG